MFRRPGAAGALLVVDGVRGVRIAFQLVNERISAEIDLATVEHGRTKVALAVEAPWATVRRSYAKDALRRLYDNIEELER